MHHLRRMRFRCKSDMLTWQRVGDAPLHASTSCLLASQVFLLEAGGSYWWALLGTWLKTGAGRHGLGPQRLVSKHPNPAASLPRKGIILRAPTAAPWPEASKHHGTLDGCTSIARGNDRLGDVLMRQVSPTLEGTRALLKASRS